MSPNVNYTRRVTKHDVVCKAVEGGSITMMVADGIPETFLMMALSGDYADTSPAAGPGVTSALLLQFLPLLVNKNR